MLPILFSLGPVKIYSFGVCLFFGLFIALYFWWKMGRDEHFDEIALFDGYFLSLLIYAIAGRLGYVVMHMSEVGTLYRILAIFAYPGINGIIGVVAAMIFLILFARAQNWQVWKVADAFVVALSMVLIMVALGSWLNGTNHVWQVSAWGIAWATISFAVVSRVRKNFRFYTWYKGEASTAQEGLASLVFVAAVGIYYLVVAWFDKLNWKIWVIPGEFLVGLLLVGFSGYTISRRIGRREVGLWSKLSNIIRRK